MLIAAHYNHRMNISELTRLAETGDHLAQAKLSLAYFNGDGVTQRHETGLRWIKEAKQSQEALIAVFDLELLTDNRDAQYAVSIF